MKVGLKNTRQLKHLAIHYPAGNYSLLAVFGACNLLINSIYFSARKSTHSHSRAYPFINQIHKIYGYVTGTKFTKIETFAAEIPGRPVPQLMLIYIIIDARED
jgi:hypothetical protein